MTESTKIPNQRLSFDEFVLFYESTERVTDQRLSLNRWNYSICTAILIACASIFNWGINNSNFFIVAVITIIILCAMAMLFCTLWVSSILNAKALNKAKFDVLTEMAPLVKFSNEPNDERESFEPFQKEWKLMEERNHLIELHETNIIVLEPSNIEYMIPKVFFRVFAGILLITFMALIFNWGVVFSTPILSISGTPTPTQIPVPSATPVP